MPIIEEELYIAVNRCDVEHTISLLEQGADVNSLINSGRTILGRAAQLGNARLVQVLLEAENYLPPPDSGDTLQGSSGDIPESSSASSAAAAKDNGNEVQPDSQDSTCVDPETCSWKGDMMSAAKNSIWWKDSDYELGLGLFHALREKTVPKRPGPCDVNLPDFHDRMPIHYAAESGQVEVIQLLLNAGSMVNVSDSDNITPLHLAVSRGHEDAVELLLKAGSRVNSKTSDKSSAMHIAASRGFPRIIDMLLRYGAKIDILDVSDRTPLLLAVTRGHCAVVQLLLNKGAKVNSEEIHGYTPLSEAVWQKDDELVCLLLEAGAKINTHHYLLHYCVLHRSRLLCHILIKFGAFLNIRDDSGDTPLLLAVRTAQVDIVELLLEHGSSANLVNGLSGQTAIHEAVEHISELELDTFVSVLELLLRYSGRLNSESFTPGDYPLYRAILMDKFLFAEELIRNGADANLGNVFTCNIDNLCLAHRKNHFRTVQLLVHSGFELRLTPWLEILPPYIHHNYYSFNSIRGWLIYMKMNPMKLSELCRITIRRSMQENIIPKVNKLHTPMPIKNYLLFRNTQFLEEETSNTENAGNANIFLR